MHPLPNPGPLLPGDPRNLGGFQLLGRLGKDATGVIYCATTNAGDPVAIKTIDQQFVGQNHNRFSLETRKVRGLAAECLPVFVAANLNEHPPWVALEYTPGPSLAGHVQTTGPLTGSHMLLLAVGTAEVLDAVHRAGDTHGAMTPENVILGPSAPKVAGLGIGQAPHEPDSPASQGATPASDIFAWASVMTYAATGQSLPDTATPVEQRIPAVPGLPGELRTLVIRALDPTPSARPTATEIFTRLLDTVAPPQAPHHTQRERLRGALAAGWPQEAMPNRPAAPRKPDHPSAMAPTSVSGPAPRAPAFPPSTSSSRVSGTVMVIAAAAFGLAVIGGLVAWRIAGAGGSEPAGEELGQRAAEDPLESPPYDAQTVEFQDVTLQLPEEWDVYETAVEGTNNEFLVLVPDSGSCDEETDWSDLGADDMCPHIQILPDTLYGSVTDPYYPSNHNSENPPPCAPDLDLQETDETTPPPGSAGTEVDIANGMVSEYEHSALCEDESEEQLSASQHIYEFQETAVAAVDNWENPEFVEALTYSGVASG